MLDLLHEILSIPGEVEEAADLTDYAVMAMGLAETFCIHPHR